MNGLSMSMGGKRRSLCLSILGTRGIPAAHGGFETFAEHLALYLTKKGWQVTVYCQTSTGNQDVSGDWRGINRVVIPVAGSGAFSTIVFDWKSTFAVRQDTDVVLVLGYNTASFGLLHRLRRIPSVINMDGIEWKRAKWRWWQRVWLYLNERAAGLLGSKLIADHPGIREHLKRGLFGRDDIEVIPYGANRIESTDASILNPFGIEEGRYALVIARPEPENQILEIVQAFSAKPRGMRLQVLGRFEPADNAYHAKVMSAASDEVVFSGAIYDKTVVSALRYHCALYVHGHTVGGTNPSLVEALGAGSAVLAHDNLFNRWVAGEGAAYFANEVDCMRCFDDLLGKTATLERMRASSRERFEASFTWESVLDKYEKVLLSVVSDRLS